MKTNKAYYTMDDTKLVKHSGFCSFSKAVISGQIALNDYPIIEKTAKDLMNKNIEKRLLQNGTKEAYFIFT